MADFQIISRPFPNGGLQLKQDPALLDESHYSELTNMVSIQEGDLAIRPGNKKISGTSTFASASTIHSIAALRIGSQGVETLYIGEGQNIWANRTTQAAMSTWVTVATGCAPTVATGFYPRQRFSGSPYSAGSSGLPYEYFACPSKMLKSDGTTAALQKWGIDRPVQPAIVSLGGQAGGILPANADLIISPGGGFLNGIGTTTISSFTGTAPGNIVITPNASFLYQMQVGMLLHIGPTASPQYAVALSIDPTTFTVNLGSTPTIGDIIQTGSLQVTASGTDQSIPITPVTIDASYNGSPTDGYSTNDLVHLGLTFQNITRCSKLSLRVYVAGSSVDYYEILIIDPTDWAGSVARNKLHDYGPFTELDFPKSSFTAVGYAGTAPYSWKFVTGFAVVFSTYSGAGATTVDLNCLYFSAVNGPNANATGGNTVAVLTPYHYVFSFRNPITGAEGNPSVEQISTSWITPLNQSVSVQCLGTTDPQITGPNSIAVYRAGGSFADNYYRFVGYATNPGTATLVTFIDQQSDQNILVANTADFDNDPPVTSSLPTPLIMTSNTVVVAGTISTVTVTATSGNLASAHVGSNATVGINSSSQESAVIAGVNVTASTMDLFFQYSHSDAASNPITIQVDSITGQPANLCLEAADSMFVAGDPNNPHVLYKSKTGRPEAFPILNFTTNIAQAINVGTPSDYIVNLTEYNGGVLCLNLNSIYYVRVVSGIMETPLATPAQRGLLAKDAWCQLDNEIWYLSYDGVYSWAGGQSQWRSAELDPLFKGYSVGPYAAIDIRPNLGNAGADVITMEASGNEIFMSYQDVGGKPYRLRYHTKFNRWSIEQHTDPNIDPTLCAVTAQYNDKTTGILYIAKNPGGLAHLYEDNLGTSDGWSAAITDGADIPYSFTPAAITMGAPSFNKTFADVNLEYSGLVDAVTLGCFYDFAAVTTAPGDTFTLAATSGRSRAVVSLQNGFQKEAYAMQARFAGASNQAWRFYSMTVNVVPLTQIQVGRAYDWDDLGWPYDKRLYQLVMEYDIPVGQSVVMNMDTMTGVIGVQAETSAVQTFTLSPPTSTTAGTPNRITANFALKDDMIVKKVRIRPSVTTVPFKHFSYSFPEFTKYPADTTLFTEWSDLGYAGDKVLRTLNLEMNSNGLPCVVQIQGDAGNLGAPQSITTTLNDRARILTLESDLITKNTRLVMTPAAGGYSQYFKHSFDFWKEPLAVTHWDSYEFNFGYNGYNFVKQAWLEYTCPNPILVTFFGDYGEEFYSITLPAHPERDIERFYLPDYTIVDGDVSFNKSKRKRIVIDAGSTPIDKLQTGMWLARPTAAISQPGQHPETGDSAVLTGTTGGTLTLSQGGPFYNWNLYPAMVFSGMQPPPDAPQFDMTTLVEWPELRLKGSFHPSPGILSGTMDIFYEPNLTLARVWQGILNLLFPSDGSVATVGYDILSGNFHGDPPTPMGYHDDLQNSILPDLLTYGIGAHLFASAAGLSVDDPAVGTYVDCGIAFYYKAIRINCGGSSSVEIYEVYNLDNGARGTFTYLADTAFSGGTAVEIVMPETTYYDSFRNGTLFSYGFGPGLFSDYYPKTYYKLTLFFLDHLSGAAGQNVFTITVNREYLTVPVVGGTTSFDIYGLVGPSPVSYTFDITVIGHTPLDIVFSAITGDAMCSGIRVSPVASWDEQNASPDIIQTPFKIYADGSRLEWMPCGADQRSAYQQAVISSPMHPSIGGGE